MKRPRPPVSRRLSWAALLVVSVAGAGSPGLAAQESVENAGDAWLILIPSTAIGTTLVVRDLGGLLQFAEGFVANMATTFALKKAIDAERPDASNLDSFPSGHTSISFQAASFIHHRYGFGFAFPTYFGASFVAFSRVYADRHHVRDVVAGAAIGTVSSWVLTREWDGLEVTPVASGDRFGFAVRIGLGPTSAQSVRR